MKNRLHCFVCGGLISLLLCTGFSNKIYAQHLIIGNDNFTVEAGLNFGPTFFLGDLGGHHGYGTTFLKDLNLPLTTLQKGAFISIYPNDWLGFRLSAEETYVEGADDQITTDGINELYRKERNLDFKSNIEEAYAAIEIFPLMLLKSNSDNDYQPKLRPYGFIGVGVFHFNPMGSLTQNGVTTWYALQPLHTEGEGFAEYPDRKVYSLTQANIPMGGGLKYFVSDRMNLSIEVLYRKTFTDYIDDVSTTYIDPNLFDKYLSPQNAAIARQIYDKTFSVLVPGASRFAPGDQRGDPKNTDAYFSFLLKFGVRLGSMYGDSYSKREINQTRCPARF
jgi:hypothetical protein